MKLANRCLMFAAALVLAGTAIAQESNPVVVDLAVVRKSFGDLESRVSATATSLEAVKKAAQSNASLKEYYAAFENDLKKLETQVQVLQTQSTAMRTRAEAHYKSWQNELSKMGNPKLREKALNRFAEAKDEFDEIITIAEEAKRELTPYMADLRDVSSFLAVDLSQKAVKSLNNSIWKLGNKSRSVVASLQHVSSQIGKAMDVQPQNP